MKHLPSIAALLLVVGSAACASANPVTHAPGQVANETLAVIYDGAGHTFTLTDRASGKVFVKNGRLDGAGAILREEAATDPVFGAGRRIVVARTGGGEIALEVYPHLPFALVREEMKNGGTTQADIEKAVPATFTLDLGKPAAELKTLGTGGLLEADKNPGSYLFLTCADPATREGVVTGWLTEDRGCGVVFSSVTGKDADASVEFKAQIDYGHLRIPAGQSAKLETLAIGHFNDARLGEEAYADAVKKQYDIKLRKPDAVYMTWYAEGPGGRSGPGSEKNTIEISKFIAKELKPFGMGTLQIDGDWEDGPQMGGPATEFDRARPTGPYPHGFGTSAQAMQKDGIAFGLWWLPFGRNHMDPKYKDKQDWFFKRHNGHPVRQQSFGGSCLDSTNPAVQAHLEGLARTMRNWGVTYFKMDGLSTGLGVNHVYINDGYKNDGFSDCLPPYDPTSTQVAAMRLGLKTIRKGAGDDVFFSGCALSQNMRIMAGSIGLVDSMRVGPDFNHDGQGLRTGPLRASRFYFMNGRIWWNDPDPSKVRTSNERVEADGGCTGAVTLEQARLTTSYAALSGQFFLVSDWLPQLPQERLDILKRTMSHQDGVARPVDTFDRALPNTWLTTDDKSGVKRAVIGVFNFDRTPLAVSETLAKIGLDPAKTYHAFDFWENAPVADLKDAFAAKLKPAACRVISVREVEDHPVLISTSRHVSSGILEVKQESWADNALSGVSETVANDPYELRIVGLRDGGKQWTPTDASVSDEDQAAGVKIAQTMEAGLLRVTFTSPTVREVKWRVKFNPGELRPEKLESVKATAAKGPYDPIVLTWESNAPFHTITRDGAVIATGQFGQSYSDAKASRGKTHTYAVAVDGGQALPTEPVLMPNFAPPPPLPDVKVDGLKPLSVQNGWGSVQPGKCIDGGTLTVAGKVCADGLGLHAPADVVYARQPEWKRFVAHLGLNERQRGPATTTVVCKVVSENTAGEKKVLATSPLMRFDGVEQFPVDAALPDDCAKVHLLVEDGGDGNNADHANWGNAGFMK